MEFDEVFQVLDAALFAKVQRHLKDVEKFVLEGAWQGQTYEEMAGASHYRYTPSYLKQGLGLDYGDSFRKFSKKRSVRPIFEPPWND